MGIGNGMRGIGLVGIGLLAGCGQAPPTALGTLEWDRITVPAPAAEVIATVEVREGQQVKAGAVLMQLDPARGDAQFAAAQADTARAQAQLEELKIGPRRADRAGPGAAGRAARAGCRSQCLLPSGAAAGTPAPDRRRRAGPCARRRRQCRGQRACRRAGLAGAGARQPRAGHRPGPGGADAAQAQQVVQGVNLQKLQLRAPRDGVVDALPYRQGDQAPIGAPLAVMLVGERPMRASTCRSRCACRSRSGRPRRYSWKGSTVLKGMCARSAASLRSRRTTH
jgi:HlyD family secretion protein